MSETVAEEMEYERPDCVPVDWLLCTQGFVLDAPAPADFASGEMLHSDAPWERLLAMAVHAQAGDFAPMSDALALAERYTADWHLRDTALRLFAQAARNDERQRLETLFAHSDVELRMEAWGMVPLSCALDLAMPLARCRRSCPLEDRDRITVPLSNLLGSEADEILFVQTEASDLRFETAIHSLVENLRFGHGGVPAIYEGQPLDVFVAAAKVRALCNDDDALKCGGSMSDAMDVLEAMTGLESNGCFDAECIPDISRVLDVLNQLRQEPRFGGFVTGERYLFGKRLG